MTSSAVSVGLAVALTAIAVTALAACPGPEPQLSATGGGAAGGVAGGMGGVGGSGGMGGDGGTGGTGGVPCDCDMVDVLLVVDNSDSIDPIALELISPFFQLATDIKAFADRVCDLHVGVVTSRTQPANPSPCDVFGALNTMNASDNPCPIANGKFATKEDDLAMALTCLVQPGTQGDGNEAPMDALREALTNPVLNAVGGCNAGFFRPEAALLIVVVSDIDDTVSADSPAEWYFDVVTLNQTDTAKVATLGVIGPAANPPAMCLAEAAPNLHAFLGQHPVDNWAFTDICDVTITNLQQSYDRLTDAICPAPR